MLADLTRLQLLLIFWALVAKVKGRRRISYDCLLTVLLLGRD